MSVLLTNDEISRVSAVPGDGFPSAERGQSVSDAQWAYEYNRDTNGLYREETQRTLAEQEEWERKIYRGVNIVMSILALIAVMAFVGWIEANK